VHTLEEHLGTLEQLVPPDIGDQRVGHVSSLPENDLLSPIFAGEKGPAVPLDLLQAAERDSIPGKGKERDDIPSLFVHDIARPAPTPSNNPQ